MAETLLPVWYIQAGSLDVNGKFVPENQGSAVLVSIRKQGEKRPRKMLLTAQHVLRSGKTEGVLSQRTGKYFTHIRAWAPTYGYNDDTAIPVNPYRELMPDDNVDLVDPEDLLFLEIPQEFSGSIPASWLSNSECTVGLKDLNIVGYISGDSLIKIHKGIVTAAQHPSWTFANLDPLVSIAILAPGSGSPGPGTSGGGVFQGTRYAGVYRGTFDGTGQHLFLPVTRLREWCSALNHELLDWNIDDAVDDMKEGLIKVKEALNVNGKIKDEITSSEDLIRELKVTLGLFQIYKNLHDCLHASQLQLPGLETAARTLNTVSEAVDALDLSVNTFQIEVDSAKQLIANLPETPATLRSKEVTWHKRFHDAVEQARQALNQASSGQAQLAGRTIRSIIKVQHPRINGELRACVEALDMKGLMSLFEKLAAFPGIANEHKDTFLDGKHASGQIQMQLQAQLAGHNTWQDMDTDLWNVEEELANALKTESDILEPLWHQVTDRLIPLISEDPSAVWSKNAAELHAQVDQCLVNQDWKGMSRAFPRFQRVCRRRFYDVDSDLKSTAEKTSGLIAILNQILTQLGS